VIAERILNGCTATLLFDTGGPVGSEHLMIVTPVNADAEWVINRWFYFDEQAEPYMWNFAEKVCHDPEYRRQSLEGHTDWARVATRYESLAPALRRAGRIRSERVPDHDRRLSRGFGPVNIDL